MDAGYRRRSRGAVAAARSDPKHASRAAWPGLAQRDVGSGIRRGRARISRLPDADSDLPAKKTFNAYSIGFFHIDIAKAQTAEGRLYLFVAIDRTSKFAVVERHRKALRKTAADLSHGILAKLNTQK